MPLTERELKTIRSISIEQSGHGNDYWVCSIGTWPESSVLAGQTKFARHRCFKEIKDAIKWCEDQGFADYDKTLIPDVMPKDTIYYSITEGTVKPLIEPSIGPCPTGYYDAGGGFYDAGEYWEEQD
tara:strand:- start:819 stop:1196 length:378 start_codon:yes stop_codon:yes gene_type:complete